MFCKFFYHYTNEAIPDLCCGVLLAIAAEVGSNGNSSCADGFTEAIPDCPIGRTGTLLCGIISGVTGGVGGSGCGAAAICTPVSSVGAAP